MAQRSDRSQEAHCFPRTEQQENLMFLVTVEIFSSGIDRSMSGRVGTTKTLHVHSQNDCVRRLYDVRYRFGLSFQCNLSHPRRQYAAIIIHSTVSNQFNDFKKYVCRVH